MACINEIISLNKTCGCGVKIASDNNAGIIENAYISKKYYEAMWMLSIIDMLTDTELAEQQKLLINLQSTLVVKVQSKLGDCAWEVPCEFTVKDLLDLVYLVTAQKGTIHCNGNDLDPRLMLGFVRLYLWRKTDMVSVELI
jgi:hypothetical protein